MTDNAGAFVELSAAGSGCRERQIADGTPAANLRRWNRVSERDRFDSHGLFVRSRQMLLCFQRRSISPTQVNYFDNVAQVTAMLIASGGQKRFCGRTFCAPRVWWF
jgi:hypothetical protein